MAGPVVSVTFLDGKGSPRFLFLGALVWLGKGPPESGWTGGPFLHRPLSMSRKHNKLDETIPPAINKAAALLAEAMRQENVTRKEMAERLKTSSAQVDRLLNPNHNPSLSSLSRAAAIVGRQVKLTLI